MVSIRTESNQCGQQFMNACLVRIRMISELDERTSQSLAISAPRNVLLSYMIPEDEDNVRKNLECADENEEISYQDEEDSKENEECSHENDTKIHPGVYSDTLCGIASPIIIAPSTVSLLATISTADMLIPPPPPPAPIIPSQQIATITTITDVSMPTPPLLTLLTQSPPSQTANNDIYTATPTTPLSHIITANDIYTATPTTPLSHIIMTSPNTHISSYRFSPASPTSTLYGTEYSDIIDNFDSESETEILQPPENFHYCLQYYDQCVTDGHAYSTSLGRTDYSDKCVLSKDTLLSEYENIQTNHHKDNIISSSASTSTSSCHEYHRSEVFGENQSDEEDSLETEWMQCVVENDAQVQADVQADVRAMKGSLDDKYTGFVNFVREEEEGNDSSIFLNRKQDVKVEEVLIDEKSISDKKLRDELNRTSMNVLQRKLDKKNAFRERRETVRLFKEKQRLVFIK